MAGQAVVMGAAVAEIFEGHAGLRWIPFLLAKWGVFESALTI